MKTTYQFPGKEDVRITIGDEKQHDFFPRMKIKRWDNEVNFSVGIISDYKGANKKETDTVEWNDGHGVKASFYEKPDDQFEFEIILDEKPASGFVLLSIETKGLRFLYQPPLTQQEIDDGCERPDDVVGSYAVYHESEKGNYIGGKNYRAGKFCHIYRPFVTDAKGKQKWCDLDITGGVMKITIPDGLVYPVTVDPTFGTAPASPGGSWETKSPNYMRGTLYTSPANMGTAQSVSAYVKRSSNTPDYNFNIKGLIVLHSNLNIITNGTGSASAEVTSDTGIWALSDFATDPSPAASTEYVLAQIQGGTGGAHDLAYDAGDANQGHRDSSNSYASPTNPTDAQHNSNEYSLYCTYTAAAVTRTVAISTDLLLKKLGITKSISTDLLLKKLGITKSISTDIVLVKSYLKSISTDILLKKLGITKSISTDLLLKKLGITKSISTDIVLVKKVLKTISTDLLLTDRVIKSFTSDIVLVLHSGIRGSVAYTDPLGSNITYTDPLGSNISYK